MKTIACILVIAVAGCGCSKSRPADVNPAVKALYLSADADTVVVGEPLQLTVIANIADGVVNHTESCTFTSSDEEVAVVLPGGKVNGLRPGTVVIHAEAEDIRSKPLNLEVVSPPPKEE